MLLELTVWTVVVLPLLVLGSILVAICFVVAFFGPAATLLTGGMILVLLSIAGIANLYDNSIVDGVVTVLGVAGVIIGLGLMVLGFRSPSDPLIMEERERDRY